MGIVKDAVMLLKEHEDDGRICASLCGIIANIAEVSNTTLEFTRIHTIKSTLITFLTFFKAQRVPKRQENTMQLKL